MARQIIGHSRESFASILLNVHSIKPMVNDLQINAFLRLLQRSFCLPEDDDQNGDPQLAEV